MGTAQSMTSAGRQTADEAAPPPVIEMRLSIQFATLPALRTPHIGLLWAGLRERYRQAAEAPPLPATFEMFGGPAGMTIPPIHFQFGAPTLRIVFEGVEGDILLHVQQDRLMLNWRRYPSGSPYPGYAAMRERFATEIRLVEEFLAAESLGAIKPNQCEVAYVNALLLRGDAEVHQHLDSVTPGWRPVDAGLPFEAATLENRYVISTGGEQTGRLYTSFSPAVLTATGEANYQLEIVARCRPEGESVTAALATLDSAHDLIGRAFKGVTSSVVRASGGD